MRPNARRQQEPSKLREREREREASRGTPNAPKTARLPTVVWTSLFASADDEMLENHIHAEGKETNDFKQPHSIERMLRR